MRYAVRILAILLLVVLWAPSGQSKLVGHVAAVNAAAVAEDVRLTCSDRPNWRFVENQGWWRNRGDAWPGQHVHVGGCWPVRGTVSGTFTTDLRVLGHAQPPGAYLKRVRVKDAGASDIWYCTPGKTGCPAFPAIDAAGDLTLWLRASFDTSKLSTGFHEMQVAAYFTEPGDSSSTDDDFDQFTSGDWPLQVRSITSSSRNYFEARGWYPGFLYDNGRVKSLIPISAVPDPWRPTLQCASPSGANITDCDAAVDMNAHAGDRGIDVPMADNESAQTPTISGLAAGPHKLAIMAEASGNLGGFDGFNTGVFVIPFTTGP